MNINPSKIYATYKDDDGHTYLIPYEQALDVLRNIDNLEKKIWNAYDTYDDDNGKLFVELNDELNNFLDGFDRLEGETYYVILEEDLEG